MKTRDRWPGPTKRERPAWVRIFEAKQEAKVEMHAADPVNDVYALEEEDDVTTRDVANAAPGTEPIRTPPRSLSVIAYGAIAFGGALVGAGLVGLAWAVLG